MFGKVVDIAIENHLETADSVLDIDELARETGESLGHMERLREETLNAAGAGNDEFIGLAEFLHAEDGDDILELVVALGICLTCWAVL